MGVEARSMMSASVTTAPPLLHIYTFGPLTIEWRESATGQVHSLPPGRLCGRGAAPALALLKFLLCQSHRYASRSRIREQFWPDSTHRRAEERLDDVASGLRTLLRPLGSQEKLLYYVHGNKSAASGYRLEGHPVIWVDADAFIWYVEEAVRQERFGQDALAFWERAYQLASRGVFLMDELKSDWAKDRREILEGLFRQCVLRLVQSYRTRGEGSTQAALVYLRLFCQLHPADEDTLRPLMELLAEQECYQEAEAYYQKARNLLHQMGRETDPRTEDVAAYVRTKPILRQISANDGP
jgi:DNA-binding SARP family transcriptional activator